jgi:hypothetical protein
MARERYRLLGKEMDGSEFFGLYKENDGGGGDDDRAIDHKLFQAECWCFSPL